MKLYIKPESYNQSRDLFIQSLESIREIWPQAAHSSFLISEADNLTIDWISSKPIEKYDKLFFFTTGIHGIEGFFGSIMLQLFHDEFMNKFDPNTTGLVIIHCINPYGMSRRYRTNQNNVDLNRNFIMNFPAMLSSNDDYLTLNPLLNPNIPVQSSTKTISRFIFDTIRLLLKMGAGRIREAALKGQYSIQNGISFGGTELQSETQCIMKLVDEWLPQFEKSLHIDIHTGYGPRYEMTLVQSSSETMSSDQARKKFNLQRIASTNPEEFYTIQGEMADYFYQKGFQTNRSIYSAAFEFGTYGVGIINEVRSLLTTIAANQLLIHGSSVNNSKWVVDAYSELYFPSEANWLSRALANGRKAFQSILSTEGYI
ncbi:M14 family metallopeptidase [Chloroflexota bacterium]